jgi:hypothetical protein
LSTGDRGSIGDMGEGPVVRSGGTPEDDDLVEAARLVGAIKAEMTRGLLATNGIECILKGDGMALEHSYPTPFATVHVWVRAGDLEQARELIAAAESGDFKWDEGEWNEGLGEDGEQP